VDVGGGEDGGEGGGECRVAVPDEEAEAAPGVVDVHEQVAGLLGQPGAGGVGGDSRMCTRRVLDDEEGIQPAQGDRLKMEQIAGQDRVCPYVQELAPRRSGPMRCRIDRLRGGIV
jgi:hypothetical protein